MNLRVNLLKESEYRYVGAVSRTFIVRTSLIVVALLATLFIIVFLGHHRLVQQQLSGARDRWAEIKPVYDRIRRTQQDLNSRRKLVTELNGWNVSRVEWNALLSELLNIVPPNIQLTRLLIAGDLSIKEQKIEQPEGKSPIAEPSAIPLRKFSITLYGKAPGTLADQVVIQFVRTFNSNPLFQKIVETVKLQSLQKTAGESDAEADRTFEVEAVTRPREMK